MGKESLTGLVSLERPVLALPNMVKGEGSHPKTRMEPSPDPICQLP